MKKIKSVTIWQSYKQERGCLVHFVCLATPLLNIKKDSARHNQSFAHNFAKHSSI